MKKCFKCSSQKPLTDFYKHPAMKDGRLNKCKVCTKIDISNRMKYKMKDPEFREQEKARNRGKYHRLGYRLKHKPSAEKKKEIQRRYMEKYPEKIKAKNHTSAIIKTNPKNQLHHWSYNYKHFKDVIELSVKDHYKAHRFLKYDKTLKMYRTMDGDLLDSREKHENYINSKLIA